MKKIVLFVLAVTLFISQAAYAGTSLSSLFGTTWSFDAPAEIRVSSGGGYTYYGYAKVGTKSSEAGWIIMRMDSSGNCEWAQAKDNFSLIYSSSGTYTYTEGL